MPLGKPLYDETPDGRIARLRRDVQQLKNRASNPLSATGTDTNTFHIHLNTPDAAGNAYPALTTVGGVFTNVRRIIPAFAHGLDGTWEGAITIPADYVSGGTIVLVWAANANTGSIRNRVGTIVAADGANLDAAYTQEAYVNTPVAATAKRRFSSSFVLSTTPAAGSMLLVQVARNGSNAGDTLAVDAFLFGCDFQYVGG